MREQYDQSRKKVSRNCLLLGALEVVLGVLVYFEICLLYTSDAADERRGVDLGGGGVR